MIYLYIILCAIFLSWLLVMRSSINATDRMVRMFNSDLCKRVSKLENFNAEMERYLGIRYFERTKSGYEVAGNAGNHDRDV